MRFFLSFFRQRDPWGNSLSVWVLAALLFAAPFLVSILKTVEMNNEVEAWLPARDPQAVLLAWYDKNFPIQDRLFLTWSESSVGDPRAELLAAKLEGYVDEKGVSRRGSPYVAEVLTPQETLWQMLDQRVEEADAIQSLEGLLVGEGFLCVELTEAGRKDLLSARRKIAALLEQADIDDPQLLDPFQAWSPPEEFAAVASIRQRQMEVPTEEDDVDEQGEQAVDSEPLELVQVAPPDAHDLRITWHGMKSAGEQTAAIRQRLEQLQTADGVAEPLVAATFFSTGVPVALVVTLSEAGEADRATALEDIERIAEECFIEPATLHLGGRPVGSAMLNEEVKKATFDPTGPWYARSVIGLSTLVSFLLAFLMVRSFRLGLLVLTVSLYATLATVTLIPLSGSTMNMVLIVMPTLLSVLTLSGAIHLVSYWKHADRENRTDSIQLAVKMAAQPCFLASATTAIGLASLMSSTLNPVRDFGIFAAIGCGISLLFVLFVLPSLMQVWPGKAAAERPTDGRAWTWLADLLIKQHRLVVFGCLGLFAFGLYGFRYFQTETKVVRYFPAGAQILTDYWFLEDHIVGVNTVDTIVRFNQQAQEETSFLERLEIVRSVTQNIREHEQISGAISLADFQKVYPPPEPDAPFLRRVTYNKRSNEFETRMKQGDASAAGSLFAVATEQTDWLEPNDRALSDPGDELWRVSAQAFVMAENDYGLLMDELDERTGSVLAAYPGISHSVTGMVPVFLRTQEALLESLIRSFGMAFAIIAVVMILLLRHPIAGLITMLPNLLPVAFCFGTLSLMGLRIDIGTMITASVALGIAVDGTLHLLTWYKAGIQDGRTREQSIELALSHCAPAMWQTSAIVALGLLLLAPASLLMISRFGVLMAALIGAALIADIVFLPALLAGPLGGLIERAERRRLSRIRQQQAEPDQTGESPDASGTRGNKGESRNDESNTVDPPPKVAVNGPHRQPISVAAPDARSSAPR
jgi:predicted RND superfamily exporter protein